MPWTRTAAIAIALVGATGVEAATTHRNDLIVMIGARDAKGVPNGQYCAAGIIVGQTEQRTLILTANHVVTRVKEAMEADPESRLELSAEFAFLPGKLVAAREVPGVASNLIDYALLSVEGADAVPLPELKVFETLGDLADPTGRLRGVIEVGNPNCNRWERASSPQPVVAASTLEIKAESRFATEGSSGGALVTQEGDLVGMVVRSDGRFTIARPMPLLLEELARQGIRVGLTQRSPVDETERAVEIPSGPPLASRFNRSAVKVRLDSRADGGFTFRLSPSVNEGGIREVRLAGASEAILKRVNSISVDDAFYLSSAKAMGAPLRATFVFDDDSIVADVALDVRTSLEPVLSKVAGEPEQWARCNAEARECAFGLHGDADLVIDHVNVGFSPDTLPFRLARNPEPGATGWRNWIANDDVLHIPSRYPALAFRITYADGRQGPTGTLPLPAVRCRRCFPVYEMKPDRSEQPIVSYALIPVLGTGSGSTDQLRFYPPPQMARASMEVDPDGRGFLPIHSYDAIDQPSRHVAFRFKREDGTTAGPFGYTVDLEAPVLDAASSLSIRIGCDFSWNEAKELCYVADLPAFFFVKELRVGTEPGSLSKTLRPLLPRSLLPDPAWRRPLGHCYGAVYNGECLALWRKAGAVFEIPATATDVYVQIDDGTRRSEVIRIPHTPRR